jgi:dienelactone hydrolase
MTRFIKDDDFDDQFARTLSAAASGCADLGEAFATADRIVPGDLDSWHREWARTAGEVRDEADDSVDAGHLASGSECFLRASEYYRQAFFYARDDLDSPVLLDSYAAHRASFLAALPALPFPAEAVAIPYQDTTLNGYLFRPDDDEGSRPTIIAPAGYDSTAESGYSFTAVDALRRGLNCLVFEGPGQGGVLYEQRLYFRPDFEAVLTPVVDWLVTQPGVDAAGLVLFGRSFAGYLAARGATGEHRIAALVCDPIRYDFAASARSRLGDDLWAQAEADDPAADALLDGLLADPRRANFYRSRMVAHGTPTAAGYLRELSRFSLVGLGGQIDCPTLALDAEGDRTSDGALDAFAAQLTAPVTTHQFTAAEGAGGHCEGLGQRRLERVVYDWIETVLPG